MANVFRFGNFVLEPDLGRLTADGRPVPLGQRAFDVLHALVQRRERLVPKSELLDVAWPGVVVEENNLQVQISTLRKLLGPQVIATVPGRGYRFTATLERAAEAEPEDGSGLPAARGAQATAPPTNLPRELPPLYGRNADLAALSALVEVRSLVTVVGAGGIGKSRLAQAVAHGQSGRWPDGAWMVELAGLADPALLPNVLAQALRVALPGQGDTLQALVTAMAHRSVLVVLDNCEHMQDGVAAVVQALLRGAPNVTLLATSQEPLHLPDEQQYRLLPLAVPDGTTAEHPRAFGAVALFEARVRAFDPRFALTDETLPLVVDICRRLDGLPLAIELAAARVATLGLRPVRDKLDARFKLLTGGSRASLRRHQTLRAALEWSHQLLTDAERSVFRRLGAFAGGFTMEMAQALASDEQLDEWAVLDHLSALVDKSLVVADDGATPRYRLLESARAFALEQLAAGESAEIMQRHAHVVLAFLRRVDSANLDGELRSDEFAALVLPELDNLRAAYAWATANDGEVEVAVGLAAHAGAVIDYAIECKDWLGPHMAYIEREGVDAALAARYWRAVAANNMVGQVPRTLQLEAGTRARALYTALGLPRRTFTSLIQVSRHAGPLRQGALEKAALDEARALIEPDWPAEFRIHLLRRDATLARDAGRHTEAVAYMRETARVSAATGDWRLEVIDRSNLVDVLWQFAPIEEAAREIRSLLAELRTRPGTDPDMTTALANGIGVLSEMGCIDEAARVAADALPVMRRMRVYLVEEWAYLFWRQRRHEAAARLIGASDAQCEKDEAPRQPNEERLIGQARADLEQAMGIAAFAKNHALGARMGEEECFALIAGTLAMPPDE